jgi:hypothetical protein
VSQQETVWSFAATMAWKREKLVSSIP